LRSVWTYCLMVNARSAILQATQTGVLEHVVSGRRNDSFEMSRSGTRRSLAV